MFINLLSKVKLDTFFKTLNMVLFNYKQCEGINVMDVFNITNCYHDDKYYYFFRALNRRDMTGIRNGSTLDSNGHINRIVTDSTFYNNKDRYNEFSELTLEEMVNHVKTHYDKDTNCISLSSDANVCLTYGRNDYEDKYVIVKVPKDELDKTTFNAGKYIYDEILKRVNAYIKEHQDDLTDLQKYYIESLENISTKEQLDNLKKTLPEEYVDKTNGEFQNGLEFIESKPYEGYSAEENLAKDKLVMLLDILDFEVVKGKTNRFVIQTMGSAFSSRELEYYKEVPQKKIVEMPTSLVEIMALIQQVPETEEIKEIKEYLITNLDKIRQNTKELDYSHFNPEDLNLSLDNLYNLTEGKISYKEAKELYLKSMYLVKAKLRSFYSVNLLNQILGNNPKYNKALQSILDNSLGIEPTIMARSGTHAMKVSDTVALYLPKAYKSVYDYVNNLQVQDMYNLFTSPTDTFNTLFSKYISNKDLKTQDREEWYANGLIDSIDLESLNVKTNFNQNQRRKIVNALVTHNFMDYYEKVKTLSDDGSIATSMFASLVANRKEFTNDPSIILDQLKDYIGYNNLKEYKLKLRKLPRRAYEKTEEIFAKKNFATAVMPTGSGKSFLAIKEMLNHKDDKMLYIAPNDIILNQIEDYIYEFFGYMDYHTLFPNLTLTTYQDLKDQKTNHLKAKYNGKYDFIILDELHRSGAPEWQAFVNELMENQDKEKVKVLGLTATPERDREDKDMAVYWARYFGYTDDEIELNEHLAINETLESAIKAGLLPNPKFVNCLYSYRSDGTLDEMYERISMLDDEEKRAKAFAKYEKLCHQVDQSSGIEKILGDNLSKDGKYVVFLPVGRKKDGSYYNKEDGSKISKQQAVQIINDYMILFRQYLYSNEYMKINGDQLLSIYEKITKKQELSSEDKDFLSREQDNIMLLDMVKIKYKPAALNTFNSTIVSTIARHLGWKKLEKSVLEERIKIKTEDMLDVNSLLTYYGKARNKKELAAFNKETNGKPKLLFVMDKLNEGAHLKGVKGIVWLRALSVDSRILFYQQLGRCIHSYPDGHIFTEEERPIVLDLVNNINTVNLKRNQSPINDLEDFKRIIIWINDNGSKLPNKNSSVIEEKNYGLKLNVILYRYIKYFNSPEKLDNIKNKKVIKEILRLGSEIDLWNIKIDEPTRQRKEKEAEEKEEKFLQGFLQVESSFRDFVDSKEELDELASPESTFDKIFNYLSILKNQGIDINSISSSDKLKPIKTDDKNTHLQLVEMKTKRENDKKTIINEKEYKEPGLINIGDYVNAFRKGKANKNPKSPDLNAEQISKLKTLDFIFDEELDPILNPRSFDDYVLILKEVENKLGCNLNKITSLVKLIITKIDGDYMFELLPANSQLKNSDIKNNLNQSKLFAIGDLIGAFKRGTKLSKKALEPNQINTLRQMGLEVVPENERDPILMPKTFKDYVLLLRKLQDAKRETGYDINDIPHNFRLKTIKVNDVYKFEFIDDKNPIDPAAVNTEQNLNNSNLLRIGNILYMFKTGKKSSGNPLDANQINDLRELGLIVIPKNERDPILMPRDFDDYFAIIKKIKEETNVDINSIKSDAVIVITKVNNTYEFKFPDDTILGKSKYDNLLKNSNCSRLIHIGAIIRSFKRGERDGNGRALEQDQIDDLKQLGLMVKLEKDRDHIMEPKCVEDYVLILKEIMATKAYDINEIKKEDRLRIIRTADGYSFQIILRKTISKNGKSVTANVDEYDQPDLMKFGGRISELRRGRSLNGRKNLSATQIDALLAIGFKFNKKAEDFIYKHEICKIYGIDLDLNVETIERISKQELVSKIKYLNDKGLALIDSSGRLIDIFSMSSQDIEEKYGLSLETIINTYGKGVTKK